MTKGRGDNKSNLTNVSPLGDDAKTIINSMNAQFSSLREDLLALTDKHDELKSEIAALRTVIAERDESINVLKSEVGFMKAKVSKLENLIDDEDAYIRRESLILSGSAVPSYQNDEISSNVARQVIKDKLKIVVQPNEISVCHRLGPKPMNQAPDSRPLTVRFCRRDTKRSILFAKRDNSDVHSTLFTNESLTPKRRTIMYALRAIKKAHPNIVTGCNTLEGRCFAYTKMPASLPNSRARDRKHVLNTHEALVKFCDQYVKKPLQAFLQSWDH